MNLGRVEEVTRALIAEFDLPGEFVRVDEEAGHWRIILRDLGGRAIDLHVPTKSSAADLRIAVMLRFNVTPRSSNEP